MLWVLYVVHVCDLSVYFFFFFQLGVICFIWIIIQFYCFYYLLCNRRAFHLFCNCIVVYGASSNTCYVFDCVSKKVTKKQKQETKNKTKNKNKKKTKNKNKKKTKKTKTNHISPFFFPKNRYIDGEKRSRMRDKSSSKSPHESSTFNQ